MMGFHKHITVVFLGIIYLPHRTLGYPDGAPVESCAFMSPTHGVPGQQTVCPYEITASKTSYQCGEKITVNVTSTTDSKIRGFLCQARTEVNSYGSVVGLLTSSAPGGVQQRCGTGHGVTHTDNSDKSKLSFTWTSNQPVGSVTFVCTLVKDKLNFWVKQTSIEIDYEEGGNCSSADHVTFAGTAMLFLLIIKLYDFVRCI